MAKDDNSLKVEKLNGENYHSWKFQMKMYLIGKDLWDITTGTETLGDDATAEEQRKFKKRENLALASVCLSVATSLQIYVRSAGNTKEAWENLESHFQKKSLSRKISKSKTVFRLYGRRYKYDQSCQLHQKPV